MNKYMEMLSINRQKTPTIGDKYMEKYPGNIPVIVHFDDISFSITPSTNTKNKTIQLLVPDETKLNYLMIIIRRNAKIPYVDKICLNINNNKINDTDTVREMYNRNKNYEDGCLHITVRKEI